MNTNSKTARIAGFFYLMFILTAILAEFSLTLWLLIMGVRAAKPGQIEPKGI